MKNFFIKALMMIMAAIAAVEGLILFMVAARRISPDAVASFYYFLSETPKARNAVTGIGAALLIFGIGLAIAAFRIRSHEKPITLDKDGKTITIYRSTVRDFVNQVLGQDGSIDNFTAEITQKGGHALDLIISPVFKAVDSVPHELERIEKTLKEKISHVFELSDFNVVFRVKGVRAADEKKEESVSELAAEPALKPHIKPAVKGNAVPVEGEAATDSADEEPAEKDEEPVEDEAAAAEEETEEGKSLLQRMFSANLYKERLRRNRK